MGKSLSSEKTGNGDHGVRGVAPEVPEDAVFVQKARSPEVILIEVKALRTNGIIET